MATGKNNAAAALDMLVAGLHARGRLRVWSLIITLFGDAIAPRGGKAPFSVPQAVMERLGIENGALRTAMSRLAADGWVERKKSGRSSIYALAGSGRHAFDEATRRIYAAGPPEWDGRWTVAIAQFGGLDDEQSVPLRKSGFVSGGGNAWVRAETGLSSPLPDELDNMLVLTSQASATPREPDRFWRLDEVAGSYDTLIERFSVLAAALEQGGRFELLEAIAARTILIHDWRRAVLNDPGLPAELLPADWPGEKARAQVRAIYTKLAPASEQWLDDAGLPPLTDPTRFAERFGIFQSSR